MTQMIVRPTYIFIDRLGEPFCGSIYVGRANFDPQQEQLECRAGVNGALLEQPISIVNGQPQNGVGQIVNIVIPKQEYSIKYIDDNGFEIQQLAADKLIGDALSDNAFIGSSTAERTFNNLQQAQDANLDGINYIYIISLNSGWEGTLAGPTINNYYYYDGTTGPEGTGDQNQFYDANGNGFRPI